VTAMYPSSSTAWRWTAWPEARRQLHDSRPAQGYGMNITNETRTPDWYPDPFGRHELRYHDGRTWTDQVSSHGRLSSDQPEGTSKVPSVNRAPEKRRRDVARAGVAAGAAGGGTVLTEPVLVVNQKAKVIELHNEYAVYDQHGVQIGAVRQVGQSKAKKAFRLLSGLDQFFTHTLQVVDAAGAPVLGLTRPAKVIKSRVQVSDAAGRTVGEIVQQNMVGKIHFGLEAGGQQVGAIKAQNWRAWNWVISDADGQPVARITKTWEGLAKTVLTTADNYVVEIVAPLEEPLRSLVVAAALAVDTALKQDARGLNAVDLL
jgi:uncharacterized protein YxjI